MTRTLRHICALAPLPSTVPDRIELIPTTPFRLADSRGKVEMYIADPAAVIAASFEAAAGGSRLLPIDFDHRSFGPQGGQDSRAAGWITAMAVEGGRIWASVEWTPEGRAALEGRAYRFISPVFRSAPDGRVVLIEGAGLVNNPALPELRQVASRENDMDPFEEIAGLLGAAADKPDEVKARVTALLASETQLASIMGAAKVAGDDAVTQICARLTARADRPDPERFVTRAAFEEVQTQLASLQKDVGEKRIEDALEAGRAAGKITPANEGYYRQLASKDMALFDAGIAVAPVLVNLGERMLAGKQPPPRTSGDNLDALERQVASRMGVTEAEFVKHRNAMQEG